MNSKNENILNSIKPAYKDIPVIVFSLSNEYVPIFSVCLESIINNSSDENVYDICILNTDISDINKKRLCEMCPSNFSIRFISISNYISNIDKNIFHTFGEYTISTYFRFFISEIFSKYNKVVYLDADIVVLKDIAELYTVDLENNYVAATKDLFMSLWIKLDKRMYSYLRDKLNLEKPDLYFQAGVMIFNIKALIENKITEKLIAKLQEIKNPIVLDQDILNSVCYGHVKFIDNKWNFDRHLIKLITDKGLLYNENYQNDIKYIQEIKNCFHIIHYAGEEKPWNMPNIEYAFHWWKYARLSSYYEELIYAHINKEVRNFKYLVIRKKILLKFWLYTFLTVFTFGKTKCKYREKRILYKYRLKQIRKF